jgi:large subunit ribosomal protein L6
VKFGKTMSRIGKKPILIPENVQVKIENQEIIVKGPKGEIRRQLPQELKVEVKDKEIKVFPAIQRKKMKKIKSLWGTYRQLIFNMIEGVTKGFEKKLEIVGVGYKASLDKNDLILEVGFSHPVRIECPEGIKFSVEKNIISVSGIDKELVGEVAAKIRRVKPPDPYKGKGIRYLGEVIRQKLGKKAIAAAK